MFIFQDFACGMNGALILNFFNFSNLVLDIIIAVPFSNTVAI